LLPGNDCGEFLDGPDVLDFVSSRFQYSTSKFMLRSNWGLAVGWVQAPGVREEEVACCRNMESEALVVVGGRSDIEAISCMWCPGCS
jgi:hypothetical protein